eukprot:jgi/Bigna1/86986/estExt_fgenesh1_pg.C_150236
MGLRRPLARTGVDSRRRFTRLSIAVLVAACFLTISLWSSSIVDRAGPVELGTVRSITPTRVIQSNGRNLNKFQNPGSRTIKSTPSIFKMSQVKGVTHVRAKKDEKEEPGIRNIADYMLSEKDMAEEDKSDGPSFLDIFIDTATSLKVPAVQTVILRGIAVIVFSTLFILTAEFQGYILEWLNDRGFFGYTYL